MKQICRFNSKTDLQRSIPGLCVDLGLAIENGVVLDTGVDSFYNDVDDPANIKGRVRDAFGVVEAQKAVLMAGKKSVNPSGGES